MDARQRTGPMKHFAQLRICSHRAVRIAAATSTKSNSRLWTSRLRRRCTRLLPPILINCYHYQWAGRQLDRWRKPSRLCMTCDMVPACRAIYTSGAAVPGPSTPTSRCWSKLTMRRKYGEKHRAPVGGWDAGFGMASFEVHAELDRLHLGETRVSWRAKFQRKVS